ncbi:MAG: DNA methyltransferase [Limisphaerales bacterium]
MFAEDTGLLPEKLFTDILKAALRNPKHFTETIEDLFKKMQKGGRFGNHLIRHFNGHLFDDFSVFELTEGEIKDLHEAATAQWQFVQPAIMGTLFVRALDFEEGGKLRAQLGAHYTDEGEIKTIVEPVLMSPLRREWAALKATLLASFKRGKGTTEERARIQKFLKKLRAINVLDPACGSGNFLYVSLQLLLALEKAVINFAAQLGFRFELEVSVQQLRAIEINPYAFELAQVSVQIGYLQWRRDNGFPNEQTPVLQNLDGFINEDALLQPDSKRKKKKSLKAARKAEHEEKKEGYYFIERAWPEADVIVGNPPFLGGSKIWEELGREYQNQLWDVFNGRVPGGADLCCYWFEKARKQIENGNCQRAGLLATQAIRGGVNREVLKHIKESGEIFYAVSDRDWILDGANVHVSMVGFDSGVEKERNLDGVSVANINADLTAHADMTSALPLGENRRLSFQGSQKIGAFDIPEDLAIEWLKLPNPHGKPNSDVLKLCWNGIDVARRPRNSWIIDFGLKTSVEEAAKYEEPFKYILTHVKPERDKNRRDVRRINWWKHGDGQPAMRAAVSALPRSIGTPEVTKHRVYAWVENVILPDKQLIVFTRQDDFFFGVIHSNVHQAWAIAHGTQLREEESGFRYTPKTCFETFPFPFADDLAEQPENLEARLNAAKHYAHIALREEPPPRTPDEHRAAIAAAAAELNELRERWLNPPEWTEEKILQFPGSADGPWARYIAPQTVDAETGVGNVVYPRLEPKDAKCAADLKKTHAHETLQRPPAVARQRAQDAGRRRCRRLRLAGGFDRRSNSGKLAGLEP